MPMLFLRHAFKTIQISLKCMEYIRPSIIYPTKRILAIDGWMHAYFQKLSQRMSTIGEQRVASCEKVVL